MSKKLSKIDYIAAQVLNGIISNREQFLSMVHDCSHLRRSKEDSPYDYIAQESYKMADAMIKESNFKQQDNE